MAYALLKQKWASVSSRSLTASGSQVWPGGSSPEKGPVMVAVLVKAHLLLIVCIVLARSWITPTVPVTGVVNLVVFCMLSVQGAYERARAAKAAASASEHPPMLLMPTAAGVLHPDFYTTLCGLYLFLMSASCLSLISSIGRIAAWRLHWPMLVSWVAKHPLDVLASWTFAVFPFVLAAICAPDTVTPPSSPSLPRQQQQQQPTASTHWILPHTHTPRAAAAAAWPVTVVFTLVATYTLVCVVLLIVYGANLYPHIVLGGGIGYCWLFLGHYYILSTHSLLCSPSMNFDFEKSD